ncbi:MAG: ABC transporter permease [Actinobacteria bacterium]|jgi:ABC-2 type transport system permease protein|nr:ABC transporter permease [Actinomycetota bacterium]
MSHAGWETRLLLRNGEQLLLTFAIPVGLLLVLTVTNLFSASSGPDRIPRALATVLAVSVLSAAFTSLAIATGFERRSGALRFLGTTPLSRTELLAGKGLATALVTALSALVVCTVAVVVGWRPAPSALWIAPVLLLGTAACAAWGMALAGLLRAEAVLAVANGIFLVLILFGGVIIPADSLPGPLAALVPYLPSGALVEGFSAPLVAGQAPGAAPIVVLASWLTVGTLLSGRTFRWS